MRALPQDPRVVVIGTSSAGKTTFARELAGTLSVPLVELDELHWAPNWEHKPKSEFVRLLESAVSGESWVADGNYGFVRDVLWPRANVIIWLNYSLPVIFWRGLRRSIQRSVSGAELWHGNRESFRRTFLSRESILLWIVTTYKRRQQEFMELRESKSYTNLKWIEFRLPSEASLWLSRAAAAKHK